MWRPATTTVFLRNRSAKIVDSPATSPGTLRNSRPPPRAKSPPRFDDSANLAAEPDVATVIIGQVVEKSDQKTLVLAMNSNSARLGYWDIRMERYLVTALPYTQITVRLEQMFVRPDGSLVPTRFPFILNPGKRAVFFPTQTPGPNRRLLEGDTFTLAGPSPGGLGGCG